MAVRQHLRQMSAAGVAALGVLQAAPSRWGDDLPEGPAPVLARALGEGLTPWRLPTPARSDRLLELTGGATALESLWYQSVDGGAASVRLIVRGRRHGRREPVDRVLREAPGVASVCVEDVGLPLNRAWDWPVRVGFLPSSESERLRDQLEAELAYVRLLDSASVRHVVLGEDASSCHIALVDNEDDLDRLVGCRLVRCTLVLALGIGLRDAEVRRAAVATGASSWAVAAWPADRASWWLGVCEQLAQDAPLDVALAEVALGDVAVHLACRADLLAAARASSVLESSVRAGLVPEGRQIPESAVLPPDAVTRGAQRARPPGVEHSTLQAKVTADGVPRTSTFKARAVNTLWVRIGPGDAGWMSSGRPFPVRALTVDSDVGRAKITVIVVQDGREPQEGNLWLDPGVGGLSEPRTFDVVGGDAGSGVVVDIYAYHQARLLQHCRISARTSVEDVGGGPGLSPSTLRPATVLVARTALDDLTDRTAFDVAFTVDAGGRVVVHGTSGPTTVLESAGLRPLAQDVAALFTEESRASGPRTPAATASFWRTLADHGRQLRQEIDRAGVAGLDGAQRIQVAGRDAVDVLPLEVVFVGGRPTERARPCGGWSQALSTTRCPTCPPGTRSVDEATDTICPLHFWGLSRVIERCVTGQGDQFGAILLSEPVRAARRLRAFDKVLVGITDQVRDDATAGPLLRTSLSQLRPLGYQLLPTRTWRTWRRRVDVHRPSLLVAIAHNAVDEAPRASRPAGNRLEIGAHDGLSYARVSAEYVGESAGGQVGPVVILLGCNTIDAVSPYQGFTREFQENGAAVVIGALGEIWVGDAPVALASVARQLADAAWPEGSTVGDVMLRVRRQLVAEDHPIAMAFAAYGDADWLLPAKGE